MALNIDIMLEIMTFLPALTPIMSTCRTLHDAGVPLLLRHVDLLAHSSKVQAFCDFCKADLHARCLLIKTFSISSDFVDKYRNSRIPLPEDLGTILRNAVNLESLAIVGTAEYWLSQSPAISDAVAALTKLKSVSCPYYGDHVLRTIARIESPLATIYLEYGVVTAPNVLPLLHKFHRTLIDLSVGELDLVNVESPFTSTTKLSVHEYWDGFKLHHLVKAFPGLQELTLRTYVDEDDDHDDEDEPGPVAATRDINVQAQTSGAGYHSLKYLCGDPTTLFKLALASPVHHLHFIHMNSPNFTRAWSVIEATRPKHLTVEVMFSDVHPTEMHSLLPRSMIDHLTHVTIVFNLQFYKILHLDIAVDDLIVALQDLNVSCIHLRYDWTLSPHGPQFTPEQIARNPMVKFLKEMDYETVAKKLANQVPSMRCIFLEVLGLGREPAYFETMPSADASPAVIQVISTSQAQDVMEAADAVE